jgi:hypothetical protein
VRRETHVVKRLFHEYTWGKKKLAELARDRHRSVGWVRTHLEYATVTPRVVTPQPTIFIADTTFFGSAWGVCVFRAPHLKTNVWWTDVEKEVMATYHYGRKILEDRGWVFEAVVVDGRRGMLTVFQGMPIQVCHFHQMRTVTKYLTRRPETPEGQALRAVMLTLPRSSERAFTHSLHAWKTTYAHILTEKTYVTGTKHWYYTHKKTRSAYLSMERNLPHLFTHERYPHLNIPNTTNSLDGSFTHLKDKVNLHHGLRRDRRYKVISELLGGEH